MHWGSVYRFRNTVKLESGKTCARWCFPLTWCKMQKIDDALAEILIHHVNQCAHPDITLLTLFQLPKGEQYSTAPRSMNYAGGRMRAIAVSGLSADLYFPQVVSLSEYSA